MATGRSAARRPAQAASSRVAWRRRRATGCGSGRPSA